VAVSTSKASRVGALKVAGEVAHAERVHAPRFGPRRNSTHWPARLNRKLK